MKTKLLFLPVIAGDASNVLTESKLEIGDDNTIYGTIYLEVASKDFQKDGKIELFEVETGGNVHRGIAYRYVNTVDNTIFDTSDSEVMKVEFDFKKPDGWNEDQYIKIMSLNDNDHEAFCGLRPYFEKRIFDYPIEAMTKKQLQDFDTEWNSNHEAPDSRHLRVNGHNDEKGKFTPKLTKQDMIIRLTKK